MGALKVGDGRLSVGQSSGGELTENRTLFEVWGSRPPLIFIGLVLENPIFYL